MNNNYIRKSRNEYKRQTSHDLTKTPISLTEDFIKIIKEELDSINTESMYASFIELLDSMQNEFKKFENSKTVSNKYRDIIDKKSDSIRQFFINCLKHTDTVKKTLYEHIMKGLSALLLKNRTSSHLMFDNEFVTQLNILSTNIKDLMKNLRHYIKQAIINSEFTNEKLNKLKLGVAEIFKTNTFEQNRQGNNIKYDSLTHLLEYIDAIAETKILIAKNIKFIESYSNKFYDDAKITFKKLKYMHNDKLIELTCESKLMSKSVDFKKRKELSMDFKRNGLNISGGDTSFFKTNYNKSDKLSELITRNQELSDELIKLQEKYTNMKYENSRLMERAEPEHSCPAIRISELSVNFIKHMNILQDAINNKQYDIKEMKMNFEKMKKDLFHKANIIVAKGCNGNRELEVLNEENENLKNELNDMKEKYSLDTRSIRKLEEDNRKYLKELKDIKELVDNLKIEKEKSKNLNDNYDKLFKKLNEDIEDKNILISDLNKKINEYQLRIDLHTNDKLNEDYKKLVSKNSENEILIQTINTQIQKIENELTIESDQLDKKIELLVNNYLSIKNSSNSHIDSYKLQQELSQITEKYNKDLQDLCHKNTMLSQYIEVYDKDIKNHKYKLAISDKRIKELELECQETKSKEIDDLLELRVTIRELNEKINLLSESSNKYKKMYEMKSKELELVNVKFRETIDERNKLEILSKKSLEQSERSDEKTKSNDNQISELNAKISEMEKIIQIKTEEVDKLNGLIFEFAERIKNLERDLKVTEDSLSNANKINTNNALNTNKKFQDYEKQIEELNEKLKNNENIDNNTNIDKINSLELNIKNNELVIADLRKNLQEKETMYKSTLKDAENKLKDISLKYNQLEIELKSENKLNILKQNEEKLRSLNLQLTNKINSISSENTTIKDDIERLESNMTIVVTHINIFFENIIKAIYQLKSQTNIAFSQEIENRLITDFENKDDSHYNLENIEKDLEFTFLIITEVFLQYQNGQDIRQYQALLTKKDQKLVRYKDEIKKLKILFDECTQTIYEAIKSTGFIDDDISFSNNRVDDSDDSSSILNNNSEREFISKAVEMFKTYNNEINQANKTLKSKLEQAESDAKNYKMMANEFKVALESKEPQTVVTPEKVRNFTVEDLLNDSDLANEDSFVLDYSFINKKPDRYKIINECVYSNFKWVLLAEKDININVYSYKNLIWVPDDNLPNIHRDIINIIPTLSAVVCKDKEIKDLIQNQHDLIKKLESKEIELRELNKLYDDLKRANNKTIEYDGADSSKAKTNCIDINMSENSQNPIEKHNSSQTTMLINQLKELNEELLAIKKQRDEYKYQLDHNTIDGKSYDLHSNIIKDSLEKICSEIQITPRIKELLIIVMRALKYDEQSINNILTLNKDTREQKKKGFLNIFK